MIQSFKDYIIIKKLPNSFFTKVKKELGINLLGFVKIVNDKMIFHKFFALEFVKILDHFNKFWDFKYKRLKRELIFQTWVKNLYIPSSVSFDESKIKNIVLMPHQKKFIKKYLIDKNRLFLRGQLLAFEPGLGKTLTSIALMNYLEKEKIIIICPNSLQNVWKDELIKKAGEQEDTISLLTQDSITFKTKWLILNFEKINLIPHSFIQPNTGLIIDEAHYLKDFYSQRTQNLIKLVTSPENISKINDVLLLTGTPLKGDSSELIPYILLLDKIASKELVDIFIQNFVANKSSLIKTVAIRLNLYSWRDVQSVSLNLPPLKQFKVNVSVKDINPFLWKNIKKIIQTNINEYIIFKRKEYINLIKNILIKLQQHNLNKEYSLFLNIANSHLKNKDIPDLYRKKLSLLIKTHKNLFDEKELFLLKKFLKLKRLNSHIIGSFINKILVKKRIQLMNNIIDENINVIKKIIDSSSKKVIIMGTIIPSLKKINELIPHSLLITGEIPLFQRNEIIKKFKEDDSIKVLIASIQTLGVGFTLTEANTEIILNSPWRNADLDQAIARIHRHGQTETTYIYKLVVPSHDLNVHSHMDKISQLKKQLVDQIMDELYKNQSMLYKFDENSIHPLILHVLQ